MHLRGLPLLALLVAGCAERARYPKVECDPSMTNPDSAQCTEESKIAAAVTQASMAGMVTAGREADLAAAIQASPREGPCPYGVHRCYSFWRDRRDDSPEPPPSVDPRDVGAIREYTRRFINGLRAEKAVGPVAGDAELDDFAQRRAERYRQEGFDLSRIACARCTELHGPGEGMWPMPVDQQVDSILSVMLREGPGQPEHDALLSPDWHRAGVGILNPGGQLYFVVILAD
ncbi:MAG TPA: hypothetical protein VF765_20710 [Polyangiaceae bacterium]